MKVALILALAPRLIVSQTIQIGASIITEEAGATIDIPGPSTLPALKVGQGSWQPLKLERSGNTQVFAMSSGAGGKIGIYDSSVDKYSIIMNNDRVGIGTQGIQTSQTRARLHVEGKAGGLGSIAIVTAGEFAGTDSSSLSFWHYAEPSGDPGAEIKFQGTTDYTGDLIISTRKWGTSGAGGAPLVENVRMNAAGTTFSGPVTMSGSLDVVTFSGALFNQTSFGAGDTYNYANQVDTGSSQLTAGTYVTVVPVGTLPKGAYYGLFYCHDIGSGTTNPFAGPDEIAYAAGHFTIGHTWSGPPADAFPLFTSGRFSGRMNTKTQIYIKTVLGATNSLTGIAMKFDSDAVMLGDDSPDRHNLFCGVKAKRLF